jgi:hypothetical protein
VVVVFDFLDVVLFLVQLVLGTGLEGFEGGLVGEGGFLQLKL